MRPHTLLNAAISIDGKITTQDRDLHGFGGDEDRELMDDLRASADAVMIGAGTLRDEDPRLMVGSGGKIEGRKQEHRCPQPHAIVVSRSLNFPVEGSNFFTATERRMFVCTAVDASAARVEIIRRHAEVIQVPAIGPTGLDLAAAMGRLTDLGVKRLLLEGGGMLNYAMLAARLVDEMYLTLCPMVIGGPHAPPVFDGPGFSREGIRNLELCSVRQGRAGRVFLRYKT